MKPTPIVVDRLSPIQGALITLAATLQIYFATLHPSVAGGDSGELMCVSHELATPHPPGYPTFAMLTHFAERVGTAVYPSISIAVAQNGFNAILSSVAATLLFYATYLFGGGVSGGLVAAFLFAFAPNVWTYAIVTEVFPLNNLFMCWLLVQVGLYWRRLQSPTRDDPAEIAARMPLIYFSAFLSGLSCTNQHTSILFVVPIVLWVFATTPRIITQPRCLLTATCCFFLGMMPYIYLPISATLWPSPNSWGRPNTLRGFMTHFLREEYGTFSLASKESSYRVWNFTKTWGAYLNDIRDQVGHWYVLAILATVLVVRDDIVKKVSFGRGRHAPVKKGAASAQSSASGPAISGPILLLLVWLAYNNFFNYLSNLPIDKPLFYGVQQRFWIQPLIIVCIFIGVGFRKVAITIMELSRSESTDRGGIKPLIVLLVALGIGAAHMLISYPSQDESQNFYVRDFGRLILEPLPPNSIVLTMGDIMINSARFVQVTENFRPDVRILDQELMTFEWYNDVVRVRYPDVKLPGKSYFPNKPDTYDIRMFLDANRQKLKRRVFLAYGWKEGDFSHQAKFTTRQFGLSQEVITKDEEAAFDRALKNSAVAPDKMEKVAGQHLKELLRIATAAVPQPPLERYADHSWEAVVGNDILQYLTVNGFRLMTIAQQLPAQPLPAAAAAYPTVVETMSRGNVTGVLMDGELPIGYRLLLAARRLMGKALENETPKKRLPTYVRRNLGVCLQHLASYHISSKALSTEAHAVFVEYLKDAKIRNDITEPDAKSISDAIGYYKQQIEAATNP